MSAEPSPAVRVAVREIGRYTLVRLLGYYVIAGGLLLLLSAVLPQNAAPTIARSAPMPSTMGGMLDWFRGEVALFPNGAPRWVDALFQMIGAVVLVIPLAFTYGRTPPRGKFDHPLVQTVIMLPVVVTAILVVVRDSLALAFSLAGIVAAVRFRNTLKESGDTVYIFGSIGIGFATGIHALAVATVLSIFFVVIELAIWKFNFSSEFEHTFARLCLPSGADLETISSAIGEPAGRGTLGPAPLVDPRPPDGDRTSLLGIYVNEVEGAPPPVEAVLERDTKRWSLAKVGPSD